MSKIKLAWHNWGRWLCLAAAGMLALGFLALYLVVWIKSGEEDDAVPSDCIVVLGAKARGMEPSRVLRLRLEQAQKAYEQGLGGKIIVCGGKGTDETVPEAVAMAAYLKARACRARISCWKRKAETPAKTSALPSASWRQTDTRPACW